MPDLMRWPEFRNESVSHKLLKMYELTMLISHPAIQESGISETILDAFTSELSKSDVRVVTAGLLHKHDIIQKKRERAVQRATRGKQWKFN